MTKRIPRTHNVIMFSRSRAFDYDSPASDSKLQPRNKEKDLWQTRRWRITFYWPEGTSISADCSDSSDLSCMNPQLTVMLCSYTAGLHKLMHLSGQNAIHIGTLFVPQMPDGRNNTTATDQPPQGGSNELILTGWNLLLCQIYCSSS